MPLQNAPAAVLRETWPFPATTSHVFFNSAAVHTVTVPAGAYYVTISVSVLAFAKFGGAAAKPVADVSDGTGVLVLTPGWPLPYVVNGITELSIIPDPDELTGTASGTGFASFCWYSDPSAP